ncbi:MAG: hypothetical protein P1V97_19800, partial [Planctomycetota bacterium]|nr:hypothetical protein [Planctomycetota bacterium]
MSRLLKGFLPFALILSLSLCASAEPEKTIIIKRLKLPASESWSLVKAGEKSSSRDFIPTKFKGKALLKVFNPVTFKDSKSLQKHLARAVANLNKDRKTLKAFARGVQSTAEGFPVAIQGELTEDAKGGKRFSLSFGVATGISMQVVTLLALDYKTFQGLAKDVGDLIEKTTVVFPHARPENKVLLDKESKDSLIHAEYRCPASYQVEKSRN